MKIKIIGRDGSLLLPLLESYNCEIVDVNPELIITYGGDGALLGAERDYPHILKLPLRSSALCPEHSIKCQLEAFFTQQSNPTELIKLRGTTHGKSLIAVNDIFIHNQDPVSAVRYRIWIDDKLYAKEIVGDGVGIATVHGSTAYYRSITHSIFRIGMGLAFCNSTEVVNHLVLPETSVIKVKIIRGPAIIVADNAPERIELNEADEIIMCKDNSTALVYGLANFMCPHCRSLRHPSKNPF
jgi:NAD+ kinase